MANNRGMRRIFCGICGGPAKFTADGIAYCSCCKREIDVVVGNDRMDSLYNQALDAYSRRDYQTATSHFNELLQRGAGKHEHEAYWGIARARYQIEYVEEGDHYRLLCHKAGLKSFTEDEDYVKAVEKAPAETAGRYREIAEAVRNLQLSVSEVIHREQKYDMIVECADNHEKSMAIASHIVDIIQDIDSNCRILFPQHDLASKPREQWEPYLYYGVQTARLMIIAASGEDSFSPELLVDANRYVQQSQNPLYLVFNQMEEKDIPDYVRRLARGRIDYGKECFYIADRMQDIISGNQFYERQNRSEAYDTEDMAYANRHRDAEFELGDGNWEKAREKYNEVLDINAEDALAYWGLLLAEMECSNEDELIRKAQPLWDEKYFKFALAFGKENQKNRWREVAGKVDEAAKIQGQNEEDVARKKERRKQVGAQLKDTIVKEQQEEQFEKRKKEKTRSSIKTGFLGVVLLILTIGLLVYVVMQLFL